MSNARDLCYVAKAITTPGKKFKTEIHSIKREAKRKFTGALTKFHYRRVEHNNVERNNDKLRRAKSDKSRSKRDTDRAYHNATCSVKQ